MKLRWARNTQIRWATIGLVLLASVGMIHKSRAIVAGHYSELEAGGDIYALPQAEQLVVFSLGFRAAAADLLFGRTMVAAGVHFAEKRVFHQLDSYLLGILALDPDYRDVYRYSDALLNLSTVEMPRENLRKTRDILEFGLERFPDDAELWLTSGQFLAYLAPPRLPDSEDKAEWKRAGAIMMQTACSLNAAAGDVSVGCMSVASRLADQGERAAAIRALERLIAIADDAATRQEALKRLQVLVGERAAGRRRETLRLLEELRSVDLPSFGRTRYQLLTPPFNARMCLDATRTGQAKSAACATSFARYSEAVSPVGED
jgi:tetratricopeptide (TPR) repeat protein